MGCFIVFIFEGNENILIFITKYNEGFEHPKWALWVINPASDNLKINMMVLAYKRFKLLIRHTNYLSLCFKKIFYFLNSQLSVTKEILSTFICLIKSSIITHTFLALVNMYWLLIYNFEITVFRFAKIAIETRERNWCDISQS